MRQPSACSCILITVLISLLDAPLTLGQTVIIPHADRGWYDEDGFHSPSFQNYTVGDGRGPGCSLCENDFRNFFVFDLSSVTQPITSAKLAVFVPILQKPGYKSGDPSENYELHDVVTPISTLSNGAGGLTAYNDLGSGVVYGSRTMTAADIGNMVEITLNSSAIAALNSSHSLFGIGGSITTLDNLANDEYTFGYSYNGSPNSELRLTLVPEPTTLLLLGIGAISLLGYRKAKSHGRHG